MPKALEDEIRKNTRQTHRLLKKISKLLPEMEHNGKSIEGLTAILYFLTGVLGTIGIYQILAGLHSWFWFKALIWSLTGGWISIQAGKIWYLLQIRKTDKFEKWFLWRLNHAKAGALNSLLKIICSVVVATSFDFFFTPNPLVLEVLEYLSNLLP